MENLKQLIVDFQKIPKRVKMRTVMEISGYPHYENVCSNILKFYIENNNEHNLDNLFIDSLFQTIDVVDFNEHGNILVEREVGTKDKGRLDLLIETDEYVIGIENKIFHELNNNLGDYSRTIDERAKDGNKKTIKIVLSLKSLRDEKITDNNFINITHDQLLEKVKANLERYMLRGDNKYISFLKDYIKTINNLTSNGSDDIELNAFLKNNYKAVEKKIIQEKIKDEDNLFLEKNNTIIEELKNEFLKYKVENIAGKVKQLKGAISRDDYTIAKQWIFEQRCLVNTYHIGQEKYQISVDTYRDYDGWKISLIGRNASSKKYLRDIMEEKLKISFQQDESDKKYRLLFAEIKSDEIEVVAEKLTELLDEIERYISPTKTATL